MVHPHLATAEILAVIDRASPPLALLAIDGHSAAGKSSLAGAQRAVRPDATVVHTDDFYRPLDANYRAALDAAGGYAEYYDWQRLEAEVLRPLRSGKTACWQKYDWSRNILGNWIVVEPEGLIIVEGCYSARSQLRTYYDAVVFTMASPAERERRQRLRNDASSEWLERWDAAERYYMDHYRPDAYADLVVSAE